MKFQILVSVTRDDDGKLSQDMIDHIRNELESQVAEIQSFTDDDENEIEFTIDDCEARPV